VSDLLKVFLPLLVFVGGSFVGPLLYWVMPLLPRYDLLYYGVGPLIWPVQLIGPLMDVLGTDNYVLVVGLNVLLYAIVGMGIVVAAGNKLRLLLAATLLEIVIVILALAAARFRLGDLFGHDGTMLLALLIALAFYGALVFLVRLVVGRVAGAKSS
jgi:hypothetical protein